VEAVMAELDPETRDKLPAKDFAEPEARLSDRGQGPRPQREGAGR
jgi:hypothetical protein